MGDKLEKIKGAFKALWDFIIVKVAIMIVTNVAIIFGVSFGVANYVVNANTASQSETNSAVSLALTTIKDVSLDNRAAITNAEQADRREFEALIARIDQVTATILSSEERLEALIQGSEKQIQLRTSEQIAGIQRTLDRALTSQAQTISDTASAYQAGIAANTNAISDLRKELAEFARVADRNAIALGQLQETLKDVRQEIANVQIPLPLNLATTGSVPPFRANVSMPRWLQPFPYVLDYTDPVQFSPNIQDMISPDAFIETMTAPGLNVPGANPEAQTSIEPNNN